MFVQIAYVETDNAHTCIYQNLATQEIYWSENHELSSIAQPVCLIFENSIEQPIASSGCLFDLPIIKREICKEIVEAGFEIYEVFELEETFVPREGIEFSFDNQLAPIPQEIYLETDQQFLEDCQQQEIRETEERLNEEKYLDFIEIEMHKIYPSKKHILWKRGMKRTIVNWQMLVNSTSDIWNAGYILAETQNANVTTRQGQLACENLELFFKLMSNKGFAQKASFEISNELDKQNKKFKH